MLKLPALWVFLFTISIVSAQEESHILLKSCHLNIALQNGKFIIKESNEKQTLIKDKVTLNAKDVVVYSDMDPLHTFEAYTKVPRKRKGKYKDIPVKIFETKDVVSPGIFYGGIKKKEFVFPGVVPESITVLKYAQLLKDLHLISPFYFDDEHHIKNVVYKVSCPKEVEIAVNLFNTDGLDLYYEVDSTKNKRIHIWKVKNISKRTFEADAPSSSYHAPHIIVRIKSARIENKRISIAETPNDLFKWYNSLIHKIPDHEFSDEMLALIAKAKAMEDDIAKTKMLYAWVQSNIKYVAFEDGMAGFIPRSAGDVFDKKYGDCKDMANLLKTLLEEAGTPAYLTWIGTKAKPYSYHDVPCTIADNHMICAVKKEGEYVFLDATNSFLRYGVSPIGCQGKEALVRVNDTDFEIVKVKEMSATKNQRMDSLKVELEGQSLVGDIRSYLKGYWRQELAYAKEYKEYKDEEAYFQSFLKLGKKSSKYSQEQEVLDENEALLSCNVEFKNDVIKAGTKTYINLNLDASSKDYLIEDIENRKHAVEVDFKHEYHYICSFKIPEGYEVDYLPGPQEVAFDAFKFETTYRKEGQTVIYTKKIKMDYLMLLPNQFESYQNFYKSLLKNNQEKISLKIQKS